VLLPAAAALTQPACHLRPASRFRTVRGAATYWLSNDTSDPFSSRAEPLHFDRAEGAPAPRVTSRTRRISVRVLVAAVIIAIHVLLVVAFVPFVRVELPAFVVTEVWLGPPESAEARPEQ
jgi:hypothetical protein